MRKNALAFFGDPSNPGLQLNSGANLRLNTGGRLLLAVVAV